MTTRYTTLLNCISPLLTILLLAWPAAAQETQTSIAQEIEAILEASSVHGAGIVVIEEGQPSVEIYWGQSDLKSGQSVTADTVFRAGSISKNVTSLIALRLIERGALDPQAKLSDIAPDISIKNPWSDTAPIQIVHLLEHTAGLPGSTYREYAENKVDASPSDYLEAAGTLKTRWPPGTLYSYSNAGHTVLARALENVTGQTFDALAEEEVFTPLGLSSASFTTYGRDAAALSKSYTMNGIEEPVWEMLIRPSGALSASPRDLAKIASLYASAGEVGPEGYIAASALDRMRRSEASSAAKAGIGDGAYGFGTFAFIVEGRPYYGHWGRTEGFRANLGYLPGTGKGFVIMLNTVDERAARGLRAAIATYLTRDLPPAPTVAPDEFTAANYDDKAGHYILATHDQPLRAWLFKALDQRYITVAEDGLIVEGRGVLAPPSVKFSAAVGGGFAAENMPLATAAFTEIKGQTYWIDEDAYIKVSGLEAGFRRYIIPAALIISILAVLHSLVWGVLGMFGRGPTGQGLWIRASLMVSGLGFIVTSVLFVYFGLLGDWAQLSLIGTVSLVSIGLLFSSIIAVLGGLTALGLSARQAVIGPSLFLIYALPASLVLGIFAALSITVGWFPLMTWGW